MGGGDFKLLALIGAWLGWQALLPVLLSASLVGSLVGGGLMLCGRVRRNQPLPFGPFLAGRRASRVTKGIAGDSFKPAA